MGLRGRYESVAIATSSREKFESAEKLFEWLGIEGASLTWLQIANGLPERVLENPKDVGIAKITDFAPNIDLSLSQLKIMPDRVAVEDVLGVVKNLEGLSKEQKVMKKPEGVEALQAFTEFFALCRDQMVDEAVEELELAYYLIHASAPVDQTKKQLCIECSKDIEVVYDRVDFFLSKALVDLLADPGEIRKLAKEGMPIGEMLTTDSMNGFKIQDLIPLVVEIAARDKGDGINMSIHTDKGRGNWDVTVDKKCDLQQDVGVGVGGRTITFMNYIAKAVKNVTPWLVKKMYAK